MESSTTSLSASPLPLTPPPPTSAAAASAAARWKAVTARDASNNTFVYAVRSTRIYCRPSCPARLARRANVEFFDTPAQAVLGGYRACKRCTPDVKAKEHPRRRAVQRARDTIAAAVLSTSSSGGQRPRLQELAAEANLTPSHFHRVFKQIAGVTPVQYARAVRDAAKADKEAYLDMAEVGDPSVLLQEGDDFNRWVDLCQAQLDAAILPDNSITLDDLIDWSLFDTTVTAKESDALDPALGT